MKRKNNRNSVRWAKGFLLIANLPGFSLTAIADITTTGVVTPPDVTMGAVNASVTLGDFSTLEPGTLTIDGGSTLTVNATNPFGGISVNVPSDFLAVLGGNLFSTGPVALNVDRNSNVVINSGSQVSLTGSGFPFTGLLIGSRGGAGVVSSVSVDGSGTQLNVAGAVNIAGLTGFETAQLNISNGAIVNHDGATSTISVSFGGFIVGGNGSTGELSLTGGSSLQSVVPQTHVGRQLFGLAGIGSLNLAGGSTYEATTEMTIGRAGGEGTVTLDGSTLRVIADNAAPVSFSGSMLVAIGNSSSLGSILADNGSMLDIEYDLYIGHDGDSSTGHGTALVSVCESVVDASKIFIGENGTLAGTTVNADIIVEGGTINPGCSPGNMTVNGNVTFVDGELVIEFNGPDAFDTLTVIGDADFSSPDSGIRLSFGNGFAPSADDTFEFISAGKIILPDEPEKLISFSGLIDDIEFSITPNSEGFALIAESDGVPEAVTAQIEIRPKGPNHVNTNSNQLVPVAILTTSDAPIFDAAAVDPSTVRFGRAMAAPVAEKTKFKDVDRDSDLDLRLWFRIQETGIVCGDTSADLTASTFDGTTITASDELVVVNCN